MNLNRFDVVARGLLVAACVSFFRVLGAGKVSSFVCGGPDVVSRQAVWCRRCDTLGRCVVFRANAFAYDLRLCLLSLEVDGLGFLIWNCQVFDLLHDQVSCTLERVLGLFVVEV